MRAIRLALAALIVSAGTASAQTRQAEASVQIERSVGVTTLARMVFAAVGDGAPPRPGEGSVTEARPGTSSAPAVIRVTGDPGRTYRVNLPVSLTAPLSNAVISGFRVWSENSGDISETMTAQMDAFGRDTLRVAGVLSKVSFVDVAAAMPITVNYE